MKQAVALLFCFITMTAFTQEEKYYQITKVQREDKEPFRGFTLALMQQYLDDYYHFIKKDSLPNLERRIYAMDLNIPGPYEAYVNEILVEKNNETGLHNTLINCNQAVLKSGKYNFKIKVFPEPEEQEKGGIQPETLQFLKVGLSRYEKIREGEGAMPDTYEMLHSYPIAKIKSPVPFYLVEGEFSVDLPYNLQGWSKGRDLKKMDKDVLKEKGVAYYEMVWHLLNNGEGDKYVALWKNADAETATFNYSKADYFTSINSKASQEIKERKGRMAPLEDYSMQIYGNGKIVTLERISHTTQMNGKPFDIQGKSPLIRNGKVKGISVYPIKLYWPEGSDSFEIIRK